MKSSSYYVLFFISAISTLFAMNVENTDREMEDTIVIKHYKNFIISYPKYDEPTLENTKVMVHDRDTVHRVQVLKVARTFSSIQIRTRLGKITLPTSEMSIQQPSFNPYIKALSVLPPEDAQQQEGPPKSPALFPAPFIRSSKKRSLFNYSSTHLNSCFNTLQVD